MELAEYWDENDNKPSDAEITLASIKLGVIGKDDLSREIVKKNKAKFEAMKRKHERIVRAVSNRALKKVAEAKAKQIDKILKLWGFESARSTVIGAVTRSTRSSSPRTRSTSGGEAEGRQVRLTEMIVEKLEPIPADQMEKDLLAGFPG